MEKATIDNLKNKVFRRVIIESPFGGTPEIIERNLTYLRRCLAHSLSLGEAPFASHGLYTQPEVLDDSNIEERRKGILAGFAWRNVADATVVYIDYGISAGMLLGTKHAQTHGGLVEYRKIGLNPKPQTTNQMPLFSGEK